MLNNSFNLKYSLVYFPYHCTDGVKVFSGSSNIQIGCKDYQGLIHNTYYFGHIETDHHAVCLMPEGVTKHFFSLILTPQ